MATIVKQVGFSFKGRRYRAVQSSNGWRCAFQLDRMPVLMFRVLDDTVHRVTGKITSQALIKATQKALKDAPMIPEKENSSLILPGTDSFAQTLQGLPD